MHKAVVFNVVADGCISLRLSYLLIYDVKCNLTGLGGISLSQLQVAVLEAALHGSVWPVSHCDMLTLFHISHSKISNRRKFCCLFSFSLLSPWWIANGICVLWRQMMRYHLWNIFATVALMLQFTSQYWFSVGCIRCINANACIEHLCTATVLGKVTTGEQPLRSREDMTDCLSYLTCVSVAHIYRRKERESMIPRWSKLEVKCLRPVLWSWGRWGLCPDRSCH